MGRIVSPVKIENLLDSSKIIETDALVDTGAYMLTLPKGLAKSIGRVAGVKKGRDSSG